MNAQGMVTRSICGQVPGVLEQSAANAEMVAAMFATVEAPKGAIIVCDCTSVLSNAAKPSRLIGPDRIHGGLWREVRAAIGDWNAHISFVKIKAHSEYRFTPGDTESWLALGNDMADRLAKEAAASHLLRDRAMTEALDRLQWTRDIMRLSARFLAQLPATTETWGSELPRIPVETEVRLTSEVPAVPESPAVEAGR